MRNYNDVLKDQFGKLEINLVKHDTSPTGLPAYIEVKIGKMPKDKGAFVLDLGNYIYRTTGLAYQTVPEYVGRGKNATVRFYMSWDNLSPVIPNIAKAFGKPVIANHVPFEFRRLIIQNVDRGVMPRELE